MITYTSASSQSKVDAIIAGARQSSIEKHGRMASIRTDMRDTSSPQKIVEATHAAFNKAQVDILVNNAAIFTGEPFGEITQETYSNVQDVNTRAAFFMTQAVLPYLGERARIINISSAAGRQGFATRTLYCISKAALEGFTRALAVELGPLGHTVNAVSPGPTQSDMISGSPDLIETQRQATPLEQRIAEPYDIAMAVIGLCEESGRWITGQTISATGGMLMI